MGMVSSQLEILGKRLEKLGSTLMKDEDEYEDADCSDVQNEDNKKLQLYIKEHQDILEYNI